MVMLILFICMFAADVAGYDRKSHAENTNW